MNDKSMEIPITILLQLGGRYFVSCTGVKDLRAYENSLEMSLPKNKSKANRLMISLNARDTYTMCFYRFSPVRYNAKNNSLTGGDSKPVCVELDVHCEQLQDIFEQVTGLDLSLCPRCNSISFS